MEFAELLPIVEDDKQPTEAFKTMYQQKIESLLYAAIVTRLDIAFAVLQLSRSNMQLNIQHHAVAN